MQERNAASDFVKIQKISVFLCALLKVSNGKFNFWRYRIPHHRACFAGIFSDK